MGPKEKFPISKRGIIFLFMGILALVIIILFSIKSSKDCTFSSIYQTHIQFIPDNLYGLPESRRASRRPDQIEPLQTTLDSVMSEADSLYRLKDYSQSLKKIEHLLQYRYPMRDQLHLDAGILLLLNGNAEESINHLEQIQLPAMRNREGKWFSGMAYLLLEQRDNAIAEFSTLSGGREEWLNAKDAIVDCLKKGK